MTKYLMETEINGLSTGKVEISKTQYKNMMYRLSHLSGKNEETENHETEYTSTTYNTLAGYVIESKLKIDNGYVTIYELTQGK